MKRNRYIEKAIARGFAVEETGGGCQWLRRGLDVITDGEASLPRRGESCTVYGLDNVGNVVEGIEKEFPSLDAALAYLDAPAFKRLAK